LLEGIEVDVTNCPDLLPVLAVIGCFCKGKTILRNISRIRFKESDRVSAIMAELKKMGAKICVEGNSLIIQKSELRQAVVDSHADHRIAMALAIAGKCAKGVVLNGYDCVSKSFPDFFTKLDSVSKPRH